MISKQPNNRVSFHPDTLKSNLHQVQVVLINADNMVGDNQTAGDYDNRAISDNQDDQGSGMVSAQKVAAFSLTSRVDFNAQISIVDIINDSLGGLGNIGTYAFNNLDKIDAKMNNEISRFLGMKDGLPPLVPKLSYERKTAYGGASALSTSVSLIFPYKNNFKEDVINKVNTLADWYLPNRKSDDLGELLGSSTEMLQPKAGDSMIMEGLKAIGSSIQEVASDIFKGCFFLTVPNGARNPTRIYFGPENSFMKPTYCGDWLVNSFSMSTTDFVVYDAESKCLRPELVQITLGLLSWRVTDNKSFKIFQQ